MLNNILEVNEKKIQVDHEGWLLEPDDWNKDVAQETRQGKGDEKIHVQYVSLRIWPAGL